MKSLKKDQNTRHHHEGSTVSARGRVPQLFSLGIDMKIFIMSAYNISMMELYTLINITKVLYFVPLRNNHEESMMQRLYGGLLLI